MKVGDKVELLENYGDWSRGYEGTVTEMEALGGGRYGERWFVTVDNGRFTCYEKRLKVIRSVFETEVVFAIQIGYANELLHENLMTVQAENEKLRKQLRGVDLELYNLQEYGTECNDKLQAKNAKLIKKYEVERDYVNKLTEALNDEMKCNAKLRFANRDLINHNDGLFKSFCEVKEKNLSLKEEVRSYDSALQDAVTAANRKIAKANKRAEWYKAKYNRLRFDQ